MPYEPKSLDLTRVQIPADLNNLVEQLSEITHDNWLKQRLADGWRHGQSRNDLLKEPPCIVPYEDLPESEKEYDRKISLGVIQTMLALGYRIESSCSPGLSVPACALLAYDIVAEGLKLWPQDTRLRQLMALALLRSGAVRQALDLLQKLFDEGNRDA